MMRTSFHTLQRGKSALRSWIICLKLHSWFLVESHIQIWTYWIKRYHLPKKMFLGILLSKWTKIISSNFLRKIVSSLPSLASPCDFLHLGYTLHSSSPDRYLILIARLHAMLNKPQLNYWCELRPGHQHISFFAGSVHFHVVLVMLILRSPSNLEEYHYF